MKPTLVIGILCFASFQLFSQEEKESNWVSNGVSKIQTSSEATREFRSLLNQFGYNKQHVRDSVGLWNNEELIEEGEVIKLDYGDYYFKLWDGVVQELHFVADEELGKIRFGGEVYPGYRFSEGWFNQKLNAPVIEGFLGQSHTYKQSKELKSDMSGYSDFEEYSWFDNQLMVNVRDGQIVYYAVKSKQAADQVLASYSYHTDVRSLAYLIGQEKLEASYLLGKPEHLQEQQGFENMYYLQQGFAVTIQDSKIAYISLFGAVNGIGRYVHELPFNLRWDMNQGDIENELGEASRKVEDSSSLKLEYQDYNIVVVFDKGGTFSFLQLYPGSRFTLMQRS